MKITRMLTASCVLLALTACTTTGVGTGQVAATRTGTGQPVRLTWMSKGSSISGMMAITLIDVTFEGRFFEITQQIRADSLDYLWSHWLRGWNDWPYRGYGDTTPSTITQFITLYSGKVVATLEAPNSLRMRCRFYLMSPASGMAGGGEGECHVSDGRKLHATFAPI